MSVVIEQSWLLEYWPIISDIGKLAGVIVAAFWTLAKYREEKQKDRQQRAEALNQQKNETRREQCARGLTMINDLLESNDKDEEYYSWDAMRMLDYQEQVQIKNGKRVRGFKTKLKGMEDFLVDDKVIEAALKTESSDNNPSKEELDTIKKGLLEDHVRECFDEFYFRMGQLQDSIIADLVTFADVKTPIDYYVGLMAEDIEVHYKYLKQEDYDYQKTLSYLGRFQKWKDAVDNFERSGRNP